MFNEPAKAEIAAAKLRAAGVLDSAIAVVTADDGMTIETHQSSRRTAVRIAKKIATGAAIGLAAWRGLKGAALGAASGALFGRTSRRRGENDATYYGDRLRNGDVFVAVNADRAALTQSQIRDLLFFSGGDISNHARLGSTTQQDIRAGKRV